jgi:hypothetical protein
MTNGPTMTGMWVGAPTILFFPDRLLGPPFSPPPIHSVRLRSLFTFANSESVKIFLATDVTKTP